MATALSALERRMAVLRRQSGAAATAALLGKHKSSFHKWGPVKRLSPHLKKRAVSFVGAPLAMGQEIGGVEKGPQFLRAGGMQHVAEKLGWDMHDRGDLDFATIMESVPPGDDVPGIQNCARLGKALGALHDRVAHEARRGHFVMTAGGDHSIAAGTIPAMASVHPDLCVVWVDAHADCNTPETSPSQHYHGMPAAHVMGWFGEKGLPNFEWLRAENPMRPQNFAFIGMRDLDPEEILMMREHGVNMWTMHEVDKWGIGQVMDMALHRINPKRDRPIHLSFDIDGCDPTIAPGTGTCSRGGLSYRESHYICESLAMTQCLVSMDLVEVNPDLDQPMGEGRMHGDDPNIHADLMTVGLGLELMASALGKGVH